jgi:hypothetical protein
VNQSLRACSLSGLARGSRGDHRTLETTGDLGAHSTLICKNDRRRRGQSNYLRYKTNVIGETLREGKESEQVNGRCRGR